MELGPVHHVSINCADVEATAPFYTDVLGLIAPTSPLMAGGCRHLEAAKFI
ncbi:MAG: VOC family protein [Acidimicrobiales bacterium]